MILTYTIMAFIVLFLAGILLINIRFKPDGDHFFNKKNSNAMRGFFCLIVILVHIPLAYQNRIQDMLGSFAYIGVTFFFMTSAFGLKLTMQKNPESLKSFWKRRLSRLLVPCLLVNIMQIAFNVIEGKTFDLWPLININNWVIWLIICYLFFWICYRFIGGRQDLVICLLIIGFSLSVYLCVLKGYINRTTWCPEIFGFVWGIVLFNYKDKFISWMNISWIKKSLFFCIFAGVLGVSYLKFKPIIFFGDYILKIVLGAAIIVFMLALNTKIEIGNKVSNFLGSISFEVYLLHGAVFGLIENKIPDLNSGMFILASIVVTILSSAVIQKLNDLILKKSWWMCTTAV